MSRLAVLMVLLLAAPALQGCVGMAVGAAAAVGLAVAEERTIGNTVDDAGIKLAVNSSLLQKDVALFRKVGITVIEGRVYLIGVVADEGTRDEASRLAWQAKNVREVNNELQIAPEYEISVAARDSAVTTELRAKILADGDVRDINFVVETVRGVVYIMGIARNQNELNRVVEHARAVSGVQKVIVHVRVAPETEKSS